MNLRSFLRGVDLDAVREATREVEERTGSEVVCVVVGRCDDYPEASWRGAAMGALAAVSLDALIGIVSGGWAPSPTGWTIAVVLLGLILGWTLATWIPPLTRLLVDRELLELRVSRRTAQAFLEEDVSSTVDRTGVLFLVAVFERRVEVAVDQGIASRVDESVWQEVVESLQARLAGPGRGEAVVQAVTDLGAILARHKLPRRVDDVNELSDEPRVQDR